MRRNDLINKIGSINLVLRVNSMQVLDEKSNAYFNFINSINSKSTTKSYEFYIKNFLNHFNIFDNCIIHCFFVVYLAPVL